MARTTGPLMSESASGTVGGLITHATWKGRTYARQAVIPNDPKSGKQLANRAILTFLAHAWKGSMSEADRLAWQITGNPDLSNLFNRYLAYNLDRWHQTKAPQKRPDQIEAGVDTLWVTTPAAFGAPRSLRFQNQKGAALNNAWGLLCSIQNIVGTVIFQEVRVISPCTVGVLEKVTISGLTPGSYHTAARAFSDTGKLLTNRVTGDRVVTA